MAEIRRFPNPPHELEHIMFPGGYPRIFDRQLPPAEWLASYVATYVERDVRQVLQVGDLLTFQTPSHSYFDGLVEFGRSLQSKPAGAKSYRAVVVYAGDEEQKRASGELISWSRLDMFPF